MLFFSPADHERFQEYLGNAVERFACRIHAYCAMPNHVHLVLQVGTVPLSQVMQSLAQRYTQWINLCRSRSGHLFQGRYKAILVDGENYLLELTRYVHKNPVAAGLTTIAGEYLWSGHRCYLGEEFLPWLTTEWVLSLFSSHPDTARSEYRSFLAEDEDPGEAETFLHGSWDGRILGDEAFADEALLRAEEVRRKACSLEDVIAGVCRRYSLTPVDLRRPGKNRSASEARALAALIVQQTPHLSMTELGRAVHRDLSSLSKGAQRLKERAGKNLELMQKLENISGESTGWSQMPKCQA